ncbi:MAG: hydrolase [Lachnospiraceae bacterium]|nr:hydrolase [Lachnospiraceae bacterium]
MQTALTRQKAIALLREHNKESFHVLHGLTVGGVLKWYAKELGYGDEADFWEICGILHDIDFEEYPDEHCLVAPRLLKEGGAEEEVIHAVCSHCYGHHPEVKAVPEHEMEKVLYAADELTGLVWAAAKMRPSKSTKDMEVSSLKKKFKDKRFAAGCSREIITQGVEKLGWEITKLMEMTILAMRSCEDAVNAEMEAMGLQA